MSEAHIRIGDAERHRALDEVHEAAADGRLRLDEVDERVTLVLQGRTRSDISAALADLVPPDRLPGLLDGTPPAAASGAPGTSWDNPMVLTARWDDVRRAGAWEVPAFLEINAVAGNVKLDFRDARIASAVVDLSVVGGAGDVIVVVPEGVGVDVTYVESGMGSVTSRVDPRARPGQPQLVLRGRLTLGDIKVRHANRFDTWQRNRMLAHGGGPDLKN